MYTGDARLAAAAAQARGQPTQALPMMPVLSQQSGMNYPVGAWPNFLVPQLPRDPLPLGQPFPGPMGPLPVTNFPQPAGLVNPAPQVCEPHLLQKAVTGDLESATARWSRQMCDMDLEEELIFKRKASYMEQPASSAQPRWADVESSTPHGAALCSNSQAVVADRQQRACGAPEELLEEASSDSPTEITSSLSTSSGSDLQVQARQQPSPPVTLMIRNVPCKYTKEGIVSVLEEQGLSGLYTSIYVPPNQSGVGNMGYFFMNCKSAQRADDCTNNLAGKPFGERGGDKLIEVSVAKQQGRRRRRLARGS